MVGGGVRGKKVIYCFSVTLEKKLVSAVHLLLLCTMKSLFRLPFGDFSSFFSFKTDKERVVLVHERILSSISSLKDIFLSFQRSWAFLSVCFSIYRQVDSSRRALLIVS